MRQVQIWKSIHSSQMRQAPLQLEHQYVHLRKSLIPMHLEWCHLIFQRNRIATMKTFQQKWRLGKVLLHINNKYLERTKSSSNLSKQIFKHEFQCLWVEIFICLTAVGIDKNHSGHFRPNLFAISPKIELVRTNPRVVIDASVEDSSTDNLPVCNGESSEVRRRILGLAQPTIAPYTTPNIDTVFVVFENKKKVQLQNYIKCKL